MYFNNKIRKFISKLPEGINTPIGQKGLQISEDKDKGYHSQEHCILIEKFCLMRQQMH